MSKKNKKKNKTLNTSVEDDKNLNPNNRESDDNGKITVDNNETVEINKDYEDGKTENSEENAALTEDSEDVIEADLPSSINTKTDLENYVAELFDKNSIATTGLFEEDNSSIDYFVEYDESEQDIPDYVETEMSVSEADTFASEADFSYEDDTYTYDSEQTANESDVKDKSKKNSSKNKNKNSKSKSSKKVSREETSSDNISDESMQSSKSVFDKKDSEEATSIENKSGTGGNFSDFTKEIIGKISDQYKKDNRPFIYVGISVIVIVSLIIIIPILNKKNTQLSVTDVSSNSLNVAVDSSGAYLVPDEPLQENAYPDVNTLISSYMDAVRVADKDLILSFRDSISEYEWAQIVAKSHYVEAYENITCYTKPGPFDNSYIVFTLSDVKMFDYDTTLPALYTYFVMSDETGKLYIYTEYVDEKVADYISDISSQVDVLDLVAKVSVEYQETLDSDENFKLFMDDVHEKIKVEGGELLAEATADIDDDAVSDNVAEDNNDDVILASFEVKTTTTVNVRCSDSEEADKLGQVSAGTVLTCNEQKANGWSQVVYEGQIAYIKTEYLIKLIDDSAIEADSAMVTGNVRAKETVNIRAEANVNGQLLGVAYVGQTFSLIEHQSNGWSKIIYNNVEAYIKTEYLEDV